MTVLRELFTLRGATRHIRSDNGPEFIAKHVRSWVEINQVGPRYMEPGSPWRNGIGESFNGRPRDECLDREAFMDLREAVVVIGDYRRLYKDERPHSSPDYRTPGAFAAVCRGTVGEGVWAPEQGPPLRLVPAPAQVVELV